MIKLTEQELEQYAHDLFRTAMFSFANMEDNVVGSFMNKIIQKHSVQGLFVGDHSIASGGFPVKTPKKMLGLPQIQQQRDLFDERAAQAEANEQSF